MYLPHSHCEEGVFHPSGYVAFFFTIFLTKICGLRNMPAFSASPDSIFVSSFAKASLMLTPQA